MELLRTVDEVREKVKKWKTEGMQVGFVPTMGYLHEGHQSLIKRAKEENNRVIVSIFVNPIQFGPKEDLSTYPRDLERDMSLCQEAGAAAIFYPEVEEMYQDGFSTYIDMNTFTNNLCGQSRPTHFRGVCTVVAKLFLIVSPDKAYFGQKDAQQLAVIRHMVRDLNFNIKIIGCPIIREEDGLAKSSRNTYLSQEERGVAVVLSKSLQRGRKAIEEGEKDAREVKEIIRKEIEKENLARIDYVEIVDWNTFEETEEINGPVLVAIAVYIGKTRLIDNFIIEE